MAINEKCTLYEKRMKQSQENDKVIFYDYLSYKRAAGWQTECDYNDWHRPDTIKKAKYDAAFLQNLPDYYFLGFPIKELLKSTYSDGYCHACAIALSLCYEKFDLVTCNLVNYVEYYNQKSGEKINEFEHTFIIVDIKGERKVIDTTWGIITDYHTYKYIFNIDDIRIISSDNLKSTEIYKFIEERKYDKGPSYENELHNDKLYNKYNLMISEYFIKCQIYTNSNDNNLQDFINRCLYGTSDKYCLSSWRMKYFFVSTDGYEIQYPDTNLFSLVDDELDFTLDSPYEDTKMINSRILKNKAIVK